MEILDWFINKYFSNEKTIKPQSIQDEQFVFYECLFNDSDIRIGIYRDYIGREFCDNCEIKIGSREKRYLFYFTIKDGMVRRNKFKGCKEYFINICNNCAKTKREAAKIIEKIINKKLYECNEKLYKDKESNMNIKNVLNNEKVRLEKQLDEFNVVKLPDNMPIHVIEHLKMKKSLIENCLKAIDELNNCYNLDETIKKLFSN